MPTEKDIKAAIKEGGKKGQDIAGLSDMGGVKFFHISTEKCNGEWELLEKCLEGFNKEVDDAAEDRKGGAGDLGKVLFTTNDKEVLILINVPETRKEIEIDEWAKVMTDTIGAEVVGEKSSTIVKMAAKGNPEENKFPLKMRDEAVNAGFAFLRSKSLVPEDESSDDENYAEAAGIEW